MSELKICPQCAASNPIDAEWCGQCFSTFSPEPTAAGVASTSDEVTMPAPVRSGWECRVCGHENDVELSACGSCGIPIYDSYGKGVDQDRDPELAVRRAFIFPGFGYPPLGFGGIGVITGFLAVATLIVGGMLLVAGELLGLFLLVLFLAIWAGSVVDVMRLAGGESQPLLSPRVLSFAGGLVVALLFLSVLVAFQAATR